MAKAKTDPVKITFFVILGLLVVALGIFAGVLSVVLVGSN